ncbi:MAG: zinc ribbon domain-containing protein [Gemmatimonadota bacterium]
MANQPLAGPLCQSCGMPMEKPEDFGTDERAGRVGDFCGYCFRDGKFTDPDISMAAMLEKCVHIMTSQAVMPAIRARALMAEILPRLDRWQMPASRKAAGA